MFFSQGALEIVAPFTSSPNYINQDKETKIMCVFSGWPLPRTVYWLKNSKLIINGTEDIYIHHSPQWKEHKLKSILRVLHGREEQEGAYLCRATNSIPGWSSSNSSTIEMKYRCKLSFYVSLAKTAICYSMGLLGKRNTGSCQLQALRNCGKGPKDFMQLVVF